MDAFPITANSLRNSRNKNRLQLQKPTTSLPPPTMAFHGLAGPTHGHIRTFNASGSSLGAQGRRQSSHCSRAADALGARIAASQSLRERLEQYIDAPIHCSERGDRIERTGPAGAGLLYSTHEHKPKDKQACREQAKEKNGDAHAPQPLRLRRPATALRAHKTGQIDESFSPARGGRTSPDKFFPAEASGLVDLDSPKGSSTAMGPPPLSTKSLGNTHQQQQTFSCSSRVAPDRCSSTGSGSSVEQLWGSSSSEGIGRAVAAPELPVPEFGEEGLVTATLSLAVNAVVGGVQAVADTVSAAISSGSWLSLGSLFGGGSSTPEHEPKPAPPGAPLLAAQDPAPTAAVISRPNSTTSTAADYGCLSPAAVSSVASSSSVNQAAGSGTAAVTGNKPMSDAGSGALPTPRARLAASVKSMIESEQLQLDKLHTSLEEDLAAGTRSRQSQLLRVSKQQVDYWYMVPVFEVEIPRALRTLERLGGGGEALDAGSMAQWADMQRSWQMVQQMLHTATVAAWAASDGGGSSNHSNSFATVCAATAATSQQGVAGTSSGSSCSEQQQGYGSNDGDDKAFGHLLVAAEGAAGLLGLSTPPANSQQPDAGCSSGSNSAEQRAAEDAMFKRLCEALQSDDDSDDDSGSGPVARPLPPPMWTRSQGQRQLPRRRPSPTWHAAITGASLQESTWLSGGNFS